LVPLLVPQAHLERAPEITSAFEVCQTGICREEAVQL
jgi:hypothetical protein